MKKVSIFTTVGFTLFFNAGVGAHGAAMRMFSCHWAKNGQNSRAAGKIGWENYSGELLVSVDGNFANAFSKENSDEYPHFAGKLHPAFSHLYGNEDELNYNGYVQHTAQGEREVIYIDERLATDQIKTGQIVLEVNNPLKEWGNVFFDCEKTDHFGSTKP